MTEKIIKLTQEAYLSSGELRQVENGKQTINVLKNWYEASAIDVNGDDYIVYWKLKKGVDPNNHEAEDACDWISPYMILDAETAKDVDAIVILDDYYYFVETTNLDQNGGHEGHHEEGIFINLEDAKKCLEETARRYMYEKNTVVSLIEFTVDDDLNWKGNETIADYISPDAAKKLEYTISNYEYMIQPGATSKLLVHEYDYLKVVFEDKKIVLGELLKLARIAKGLNQEKLADEIGITRNALQKYEYGDNTPGAVILFKIKNILDIDQDLIDEALENEE